MGDVLWTPKLDGTTALERFGATHGFATYDGLWRWSVTEVEAFWAAVWEWCDVIGGYDHVLSSRRMPGGRWFEGAQLSYTEHALRGEGGIIALSQTREPVDISANELRRQVAACRAGLARLGVGTGDRVAAYLPNIPETIVAFLATASLGAIWTSAAPEFGVQAVLDRFGQVEPKVLLTIDGYQFGNKRIDRREQAAEIVAGLPTVGHVVHVPYLHPDEPHRPGSTWAELLAADGPLDFERVPPDHPLYVLYTSGTTGLPKAIVHGHGGILLEHLKVLTFHAGLGPGDRFFWFTTTGWMMWNYLVSGLLVGSTIVLFDGDPGADGLRATWRLAAEHRVDWFGTSAPFISACQKAGLSPGDEFDLSTLRAVGSTGAPLAPEGFRWVYERVSPGVLLSSISGGTDICSAFVGGSPTTPVREGEISVRYLGAAVESWNGELVVTQPMPSMPVGLCGDPDGSAFRRAYFEANPGVWTHGDWVEFTESGGLRITGRSDATLNRAGVRIGTAEIYRIVEALPDVTDSLIVHLEADDSLVLFIATGAHAAAGELAVAVRRALGAVSPRHVPNEVHVVQHIPTTLSGKKLEIPVKRILGGADPDTVCSRDSLRDPAALDAIVAVASQRLSGERKARS